MSSSSPQLAETAKASRFPDSMHVYSASTALCLSHSENRKSLPTITLDFSKSDGSGRFLWDSKVSFQLSQGELAELASVLAYPGGSLQFKHSPAQHTLKTLKVIPQGHQYVFSLASNTGTFHIPVSPSDQFFVKNFLVRRISEFSSLDAQYILISLRSLARQLQALDSPK